MPNSFLYISFASYQMEKDSTPEYPFLIFYNSGRVPGSIIKCRYQDSAWSRVNLSSGYIPRQTMNAICRYITSAANCSSSLASAHLSRGSGAGKGINRGIKSSEHVGCERKSCKLANTHHRECPAPPRLRHLLSGRSFHAYEGCTVSAHRHPTLVRNLGYQKHTPCGSPCTTANHKQTRHAARRVTSISHRSPGKSRPRNVCDKQVFLRRCLFPRLITILASNQHPIIRTTTAGSGIRRSSECARRSLCVSSQA